MLTQLFQSIAVPIHPLIPVGNLVRKELRYSKVDSVYKNKQEKKHTEKRLLLLLLKEWRDSETLIL